MYNGVAVTIDARDLDAIRHLPGVKAVAPNHDGDLSDHLDVINLSLGSPYGTEEDSTSVAGNNTVLAVPATAIGLTSTYPVFHYHADSYAANGLISASAVHTYTAGTPGLDFSGGLSGTPL